MMVSFTPDAFQSYYTTRNEALALADVGAAGGVQPPWSTADDTLAVYAFEPDARSRPQERQLPYSYHYVDRALHSRAGIVDFHLARDPEKSSLLRPNKAFLQSFPDTDRFDILRSIQIEVETLDMSLSQLAVRDLDFIKLDVQGAALPVLQGARENLKRNVFGLHVEVEFGEVYEGQALFTDVNSYVRSRGFVLFDLKPYYWKRSNGSTLRNLKGQLIFGEALYLRDLHQLRAIIDRGSTDDSLLKFIKCVHICLIYGYFDYALEIVDFYGHLLDSKDRIRVREAILATGRAPTQLPGFPGRAHLARLMLTGWQRLRYQRHWWAMSGEAVGNSDY